MSRVLKLATIVAVLAVSHVSPANAALTRSQAEAKAQVIQDGQCGRGGSWLCNNKRFPGSICLQGNGYWYCNGGVQQVSIWPWGGSRTCNIYTHVQSGVARLVDNGCF